MTVDARVVVHREVAPESKDARAEVTCALVVPLPNRHRRSACFFSSYTSILGDI